MEGRRNPFVAREGIPLLIVAGFACVVAVRQMNVFLGLPAAVLFVALYLLFRDPHREIPSVPLGVVSPVDGRVVDVDQGEVHRIRIQVNSFGTYTARAPVEGKIMDPHSNALWVQTDEGDDVVLNFIGHRLGLAPQSFIRFGERVGQGQRCAFLRLTRFAEVELPIASQVLVSPGQVVVAGSDLIAKVPHP